MDPARRSTRLRFPPNILPPNILLPRPCPRGWCRVREARIPDPAWPGEKKKNWRERFTRHPAAARAREFRVVRRPSPVGRWGAGAARRPRPPGGLAPLVRSDGLDDARGHVPWSGHELAPECPPWAGHSETAGPPGRAGQGAAPADMGRGSVGSSADAVLGKSNHCSVRGGDDEHGRVLVEMQSFSTCDLSCTSSRPGGVDGENPARAVSRDAARPASRPAAGRVNVHPAGKKRLRREARGAWTRGRRSATHRDGHRAARRDPAAWTWARRSAGVGFAPLRRTAPSAGCRRIRRQVLGSEGSPGRTAVRQGPFLSGRLIAERRHRIIPAQRAGVGIRRAGMSPEPGDDDESTAASARSGEENDVALYQYLSPLSLFLCTPSSPARTHNGLPPRPPSLLHPQWHPGIPERAWRVGEPGPRKPASAQRPSAQPASGVGSSHTAVGGPRWCRPRGYCLGLGLTYLDPVFRILEELDRRPLAAAGVAREGRSKDQQYRAGIAPACRR
ncbi:hypothetical protein B2J93_159 [Marssonina coronariae]|uniref:Uncharacterized protein n=1 Tax=Diplocarpon coronariae TaxID=2795749 RepID=A0A218YSR4_9HELO|nr:hypothetical protein B2J93_159 [Marssonina coronariae]